MKFPIALCAVLAAGFVALGQEIVWFRVLSFVSGGRAGSFGVLLAAYLAGIALGSAWARSQCRDGEVGPPSGAANGEAPAHSSAAAAAGRPSQLPAVLTALAAFGGFLLVPAIGLGVTKVPWHWTLPGIAVVAAIGGAVLPLVAHLGIAADHRAGERLSLLYLANIVGCTAGSLTTGFVLLDRLTLRQTSVVLTLVGLGLAGLLFLAAGLPRRALLWRALALAVLAALTVGTSHRLYARIWPQLQRKLEYDGGELFARVIENRAGVITVDRERHVFGGGVYDGILSVSLLPDRNLLYRAYALPAVHPAPKRVLMVGLASGSWARVIASAPGVERFEVVEINPGYLELIAAEPEVSPLLRDPKVVVHIDDGRRWLAAHPTARFDVIVQNTSWHWRGHITNLLSEEYFALVRARLSPGGVFFFNTTHAPAAMVTACRSFRSGFRFSNFMYVSDAERLDLDLDRWREALRTWQLQGKPVLDLGSQEGLAALDDLLSRRAKPAYFQTCAEVLAQHGAEPSITDDNMRTEFLPR